MIQYRSRDDQFSIRLRSGARGHVQPVKRAISSIQTTHEVCYTKDWSHRHMIRLLYSIDGVEIMRRRTFGLTASPRCGLFVSLGAYPLCTYECLRSSKCVETWPCEPRSAALAGVCVRRWLATWIYTKRRGRTVGTNNKSSETILPLTQRLSNCTWKLL